MGQEAEGTLRRAVFAPYRVDARLLAHRGEEVTIDVLDSPQSRVFAQAENRLHVQKAVLRALVGDRGACRSLDSVGSLAQRRLTEASRWKRNRTTRERAVLALEDGAVFYGCPFGAVDALVRGRRGEVVFATGMTGYQEICTDPSYRGQMVCLTYPLIGNYGVAVSDAESRRPWLAALLVRECCDEFSNWRATGSLNRFLLDNGIPGVSELDTRALTRHLRTTGTLRGVLRAYPAGSTPDVAALVAEAQQVYSVSQLDVVGEVASAAEEIWEADGQRPSSCGRPLDTPTLLAGIPT